MMNILTTLILFMRWNNCFIAYYKELGQCIWNRTGKSAYSKYEKTQEHKKAGPTILTKSLADQVREYIYQQIILPSRCKRFIAG